VKVLVTGAGGFVGRALLPALAVRGHVARPAARRAIAAPDSVVVPDVGPDTDWRAALDGCDGVVHLAARVHMIRDTSADPLADFRRVNRDGTRRLAEAAVAAGVSRFVFVSTAKVLGECSAPGRPFDDSSPPAPRDPYSVSKLEAETALREACAGPATEWREFRPPLVYGPGVGANFLRLLQAVDRRRPLPLGLIANRRSLVYVGNLVAAIVACLEASTLAGAGWLVTDGEDLSSPELVRRIAAALGVRPSLLPVPPAILRLGARMAGKSAEADRLLGDLAFVPTALARELSWRPPFTVDDGLAETVRWYRARGRGTGSASE